MSHFTSPAAIQTVHPDRSRIGLIALWAAQLALAGMFLLAGGSRARRRWSDCSTPSASASGSGTLPA